MSSFVGQREVSHLIRIIQDQTGVASALELKKLLLEGVASGEDLELDLESIEEIDVTVLQLLWAARREAGRTGTKFVIRSSDAAAGAIREAGFGALLAPLLDE